MAVDSGEATILTSNQWDQSEEGHLGAGLKHHFLLEVRKLTVVHQQDEAVPLEGLDRLVQVVKGHFQGRSYPSQDWPRSPGQLCTGL